MSTDHLFYYTRKVPAKDKDGQDLILKVQDFFNVHRVLRGWWHNAEEFHVMLDDGHEEARNKEIQLQGGKKIQTGRERDWYFTQITLEREDAERLKKFTEMT
jgi:hypothetical protein